MYTARHEDRMHAIDRSLARNPRVLLQISPRAKVKFKLRCTIALSYSCSSIEKYSANEI